VRANTYSTEVAGRRWDFRDAGLILPVLALVTRLAFGFYFIWTGIDKLVTDFTAKGWLLHATQGPLKGMFVNMGESGVAVSIVDPLVVYGQIIIGLALVLGIFTRFALLMAATQMLLFYLPALWPEHNPFLDDHIFYILIFALLGAVGAGRFLGLDALIEKSKSVRRAPLLRYVLG
jgi:thiosulfate dehydrogenase [quinone] large subunit